MKEKKQIDKLFQEHFRNFDASPPPEAWANIKAQLEKKKEDRKVIPIWWKAGGVAALLALLLTVGNAVFNSGTENPQLTEENTTIKDVNDPDKDLPVLTDNESDEVRIATENENDKNIINSENDALSNDQLQENKLDDKDAVKTGVATEKSAVQKKKISNEDLIRKDKVISGVSFEKDAVADVVSEKKTADNKTSEKITADKTSEEGIAGKIDKNINDIKTIKDPLIKNSDAVTEKKVEAEAVAVEADKPENEPKNAEDVAKKSIFDAIEENKAEDAVVKSGTPDNRWEVSPNVGPVYYSSFGNGSSLDPSFSDNSQSGDVNFSYGAAVSYVISEKLSVRTGINNVNLSYSTAGLELGTGPVSSALKSVDYGGRQNVITAVDKGSLQNSNGSPEGGPFSNLTPKAGGSDATITQSINYYEVPMELKYALINKKFGVHMIGGFSTLFLGNDEVSVQAGDFNTVLGPANNLNSLSFTTNIGLGFDYKISKRLKFNIEPMFKYQLNPYSDTSVDFNPFYMGVYTGLSFKF